MRTGAFFGAGAALLGACCVCSRCSSPAAAHALCRPWLAARLALGLRNAAYRPGRSVLSIAVIAVGDFILISVDAFRRDEGGGAADPRSGVGGYSVLVESLLPVMYDPITGEGRVALNLFEPRERRRRASSPAAGRRCELPEPVCSRRTRASLRRAIRSSSRVASSFRTRWPRPSEERANPWLLLRRAEPDGAIPVIADANSMTYVLHRGLGEDFVIQNAGRRIRLRLVGALRDSIFQGELLMSAGEFPRALSGAGRIPGSAGRRAADAEATAKENRERAERSLAPTHAHGGAAGRVPSRREHLSLDVSDARRARTPARDGRPRHRAASQRARAAARAGAAGRGRIPPRHFLLMVVVENALLLEADSSRAPSAPCSPSRRPRPSAAAACR